jgi:CRP/FNR family transcriptional regulator, nitrogen fixation regulation protein
MILRPERVGAGNGEPVDLLHAVSARADSLRKLRAYRRNQQIYDTGEGTEHWYCLLSGAARTSILLADGRRRIVDFLMPGDFFGFRARHTNSFAAEAIISFAAEAIVPGTHVACYPRHALEIIADSDALLGRRMRDIALESISRSQARLLILGRVTALEKVRAFLEEMAQRSFDRREQAIVLPMSRYDIADYLAISVETVCRALTELKRRGSIKPASTRRIRMMSRSHVNN